MENKKIEWVEGRRTIYDKENFDTIRKNERYFLNQTKRIEERINGFKEMSDEQKSRLIQTVKQMKANRKEENKEFLEIATAFYKKFDIWTKLHWGETFVNELNEYHERVRKYRVQINEIISEIKDFIEKHPEQPIESPKETQETPESELTKDEILSQLERQKQIYAKWARDIKGTRGLIRKSYEWEMNLCSKIIERLEEALKQKG